MIPYRLILMMLIGGTKERRQMALEEVLALVETGACRKRTSEFTVGVVVIFVDVLEDGGMCVLLCGGAVLQGLGGEGLEFEVWVHDFAGHGLLA
jgi:hypothetical protein